MIKNIFKGAILFVILGMLFSCSDSSGAASAPDGSVSMTATVDKLGEKIEVTVLESEYTSGIHWVITSEQTEFYGKNGEKTGKDAIKAGDTVEILYSGQVMMSYPPQIVARRITVK